MTQYKTPQIGMVVLRQVGGGWREDWVRQARIGEEQAILVWGSDESRHKPGVDVWKERPTRSTP